MLMGLTVLTKMPPLSGQRQELTYMQARTSDLSSAVRFNPIDPGSG
jgi:hypothetical protein